MFAKVPERRMRRVRSLLLFTWLVLTVSMATENISSRLFWSSIWLVPAALMIFGHESWRRICPLSHLSQLPRNLGIQRKKNGAVPLIASESWLYRHHFVFQFSFLFVGIALRILLIQNNALYLSIFLFLTMGAALTVGVLFGGKSWCQFFCPIAPVQRFYSSPAGLFETTSPRETPSQSMCRRPGTKVDVPACVGCRTPCPDIDLEQSHWNDIRMPGRMLVYYGYPGLVMGYFLVKKIFVSNSTLQSLSESVHLASKTIPVPNIVFVALFLMVSTLTSYSVLSFLELGLSKVTKQKSESLLHKASVFATWITINIYYLASPPVADGIHPLLSTLGTMSIATISTVWAWRSLGRSAYQYAKETLVEGLRKQLLTLKIDFTRLLGGKSLNDLKTDEVILLSQTIPAFSGEQKRAAYKELLRNAKKNDSTNNADDGLTKLGKLIDISGEDHQALVTEIEVEERLERGEDLSKTEDALRISRFEQALQSYVKQFIAGGGHLSELKDSSAINEIAKVHNITSAERALLVTRISEVEDATVNEIQAKIETLAECSKLILPLSTSKPEALSALLISTLERQKSLLVRESLFLLAQLGDATETNTLARALAVNAGATLRTELVLPTHPTAELWERLLPIHTLEALLEPPFEEAKVIDEEQALTLLANKVTFEISGVALLALFKMSPSSAKTLSLGAESRVTHWFFKSVSTYIQSHTLDNYKQDAALALTVMHRLEELLRHPFFQNISLVTLLELANKCRVSFHNIDDVVAAADDTESVFVWRDKQSHCIYFSRADLDHLLGNSGSAEWISTRKQIFKEASASHKAVVTLDVGLELELQWGENETPTKRIFQIQSTSENGITAVLVSPQEESVPESAQMITANFRTNDSAIRLGFVSYVLESKHGACKILLSRPQTFFPHQPRKKVRVDCEFPGKLSYLVGGKEHVFPFVTHDLGSGGASLEFFEELSLPLDTEIRLTIEPTGVGRLQLEARVIRWKEFSLPNGVRQWNAGVMFTNMTPETQQHLYRVVFNTLRRQMQSAGAEVHGWQGFRRLVVKDIRVESDDVKSFYFAPTDSTTLPSYKPGQFLTVKNYIPQGEDAISTQIRCYSLSDSFIGNMYRISVKRQESDHGLGVVSNFLHTKVSVGDVVSIGAPKGDFFLDPKSETPAILIAGGIGITPLLSMLKAIARENPSRTVTLYYGVAHGGVHHFKKEIEELKHSMPHFTVKVYYSTPRPSDEFKIDGFYEGRMSAQDIVAESALNAHFYLCAAQAMMTEFIDRLQSLGVDGSRIHHEAFATNLKPPMDKASVLVRFAASQVTLTWTPEAGTLLDLAESNNLKVPTGCRTGNCHTCAVPVLDGEVQYVREPSGSLENRCLLCVGFPKTDIVIDV